MGVGSGLQLVFVCLCVRVIVPSLSCSPTAGSVMVVGIVQQLYHLRTCACNVVQYNAAATAGAWGRVLGGTAHRAQLLLTNSISVVFPFGLYQPAACWR